MVVLLAGVVLTLMLSLENSVSPFVLVVMVVETAKGCVAVGTMGMDGLGWTYGLINNHVLTILP